MDEQKQEMSEDVLLFAQAKAHYDAKRYKEALPLLQAAAELPSATALIFLYLGWTYQYGFRGYEKALEAYDQAIALEPETAAAWNAKASILFTLKRYAEAIEAYQQCQQCSPAPSAALQFNIGLSYYNLPTPKYEESLDYCNHALEIDPTHKKARRLRALNLAWLERYEEAVQAFAEAQPLDDRDYWFFYRQGVALFGTKRYADALPLLQAAAELPNARASVFVYLGRTYHEGPHDYDKALAAHERATMLDPEESTAWHGKGFALYMLGRNEESLLAYEHASSLRPQRASYWNSRGNALRRLLRYDESLAAYDRSIELDPKYDYPWNGKGLVYLELKLYEEALNAFEQGIAVSPRYYQAWLGKCRVLNTLGRHEEAMAACEQAIALNPRSKEARMLKGQILLSLGRIAETREIYEAIYAENPTDWRAMVNLGNALIAERRFEEALPYIDAGLDLAPAEFYAWASKASALERSGHMEEALAAYQRAAQLAPHEAELWQQIGDLYFAKQHYTKALEAYEQARGVSTESTAYMLHSIAGCYYFLDDNEAALVACDEALRIDPTHNDTLRLRAFILFRLKRFSDAIQAFEQATAYPQDPDFWRTQAILLAHAKQYEKALTSIDQALLVQPDSAVCWHLKGTILNQLGHLEEGYDAIDKAFALDPNFMAAQADAPLVRWLKKMAGKRKREE